MLYVGCFVGCQTETFDNYLIYREYIKSNGVPDRINLGTGKW